MAVLWCVAPEIGQDLLGAGERGLAVNHPVVRSQRGLQALQLAAVAATGGLQPKLAVAVRGAEEVEILAAEDLRERGRREQEAVAGGGEPTLPVRAQAAVGDDAVNMDVLPQILSPSMQHHGDPQFAAEPAGIAAELEESLGGRLEEQPVDQRRVGLGDGVDLVGQG